MKALLFTIILTISFNSHSQKEKDSLFHIWNTTKEPDSIRAKAYNRLILEYYTYNKPDSAYIMIKDLEQFVLDKNIKRSLGGVLITLGNTEISLGNNAKATENYIQALKLFQKYNNKKGEGAALNNIGRSFKISWDFDKALNYYHQSLEINKTIKDSLQIALNLTNIGNIYAERFKSDEAIRYFEQSIEISNKINDLKGTAVTTLNLGTIFLQKKEYSKGITIINDALDTSKIINAKDIEVNALKVLMSHYYSMKQYDKSIFYSNKCLNISKELSNKTMMKDCYSILYEIYKETGNYKLANRYLEDRLLLDIKIENIKSNQKLQRLEIDRYRIIDSLNKVEETIKLNFLHQSEIQQKNIEKTNLIVAWGGSLSAISILAFIIFRSAKQKAKKERQEQIEEKEKILKDLELSTIDAMIQGQEKERERLAVDLHDSVGATLSAARMQFDFLVKNQNDAKYSEELIKKTSRLLEDAYIEIRSMAHLKNSGVMAKNGLLPAVKKLSSNASSTNGLIFEVQSFGLEKRLENSLEISIFRIIQELVTNVIKHANATKGIVHLTNHDDNLNIMVEDNGIGFNPKLVTKTKTGMGITSIDKRVERLEGEFTIESKKNQGTTIIIDIPL
jgi:signal transduction histidine kinase